LPRAYWLPWIMLEQHANAAGPPPFDRLHECARFHHIPAEVYPPEYAGIALERAVRLHRLDIQTRKLALRRPQYPCRLHRPSTTCPFLPAPTAAAPASL